MLGNTNEWSAYRGSAERNPCRPDGTPIVDPVRVEWKIGVRNAEILSEGVLVSGDRVPIARTDGISVLEIADGRQVWKATTLRPLAMVVDESRLFVAAKTAVRAFDLKSGAERWTAPVRLLTAEYSSDHSREYYPQRLALSEHGLCVTTSDGVISLDRDTGVIQWRTALPNSRIAGLAASTGIIFAKSSANVVGIDPRTGNKQWTHGSESEWLYGEIRGVERSQVIVTRFLEDGLYGKGSSAERIAICDGRTVGEVNIPKMTPQLFANNACYASGIHGSGVLKYRIDRDSVAWRQSGETTATDPVLVGHVLYVPTREGIVGLNTKTGNTEMRYNAIGPARTVAAADESMFVASETELSRLSGTKQRGRITAVY